MTRLSNRQFPMLGMFADAGSDFYMKVEDARIWDQRPFRSMLVQEWIAYRPGKGFHITRAGRDAWEEFRNTEIRRKNPNQPLTRFFDATAYGLAVVKRSSAA